MTFDEFVRVCAWAAALTWAITIPLIMVRQIAAWRGARDADGATARTLIAGLFITGALSAGEAFALWWLVIIPPPTRFERMVILAAIMIGLVLRGLSYLSVNLRVLGGVPFPIWRRRR